MEHLHHNGVLFPPRYEGKGLTIKAKEKKIELAPEQEEMALAWAKKLGTPYVEDHVFAKNFHRDFSNKLGIKVKPGYIDYSEVLSFVEKERAWKANLSREERRQLAVLRKAQKEANKERYGYAWVDGVQMEVARAHEHVRSNSDSTVTFQFLRKDSVPHVFKVELPDNVIRNLKEFAANTRSTLFDGVDSKYVSKFLDEVMTGLSAKVFRTCYASEAVETKLEKTPVKLEEPEYRKKYIATMANLEAAKVCNHRRTISKAWKTSLEKKKARLKALKDRAKEAQAKLRQKAKAGREIQGESGEKRGKAEGDRGEAGGL